MNEGATKALFDKQQAERVERLVSARTVLLQTQIAVLQEEIALLEQENSQYKNECAKLQENIDAIEKRCSVLHTMVRSYEGDLASESRLLSSKDLLSEEDEKDRDLLIALDFDDTLYPFLEVFRNYLTSLGLPLIPNEQITGSKFDQLTGLDQDFVQGLYQRLIENTSKWARMHTFFTSAVLPAQRRFPMPERGRSGNRFLDSEEETLAFLQECNSALLKMKKELGATYCVITARSRKHSLDIIKDFCEEWFPGLISSFHFCETFNDSHEVVKRTKNDVCKELGAFALIDDGFGHLHPLETTHGILFGKNKWTELSHSHAVREEHQKPSRQIRIVREWKDVPEEIASLVFALKTPIEPI
jgi:FtsZ-binding cell division protein ZapB